MSKLSHRNLYGSLPLAVTLALAILQSGNCQVNFDGRFRSIEYGDTSTQLPTAVSWPASTITATFVGSSSVTAVVRDLTYSSQTGVALLPGGITLVVDGAGVPVSATTDGNLLFILNDLPLTVSTVSLTKEDGPEFGSFEFVGFFLDGNPTARFLPTLPVPVRGLEFIGDSITAGFGAVGNDASCISEACGGTWCQVSAASQSFPFLAAKHFGAQSHSTAWSGAGLTRNPLPSAALLVPLVAGALPPNLPEFYPRSDACDPTSVWDYSLFVPQVVVIAIGINDFLESSAYPLLDAWTQVYLGALNALSAVYPGVKIIMVEYPESVVTAYAPGSSSITQGTSIISPANYPVYQSFHQAAFARAQAAGLTNVEYIALPATVGAFPRGCTGHPGVAGQLAIAEALIPFISQVTGW